MTASEPEGEQSLPETVPVLMPELPATLRISTAQQFKAVGDHTRSLVLNIIKHEPATAKQISTQLHIPASTISHHLQVLEAAGLAQIVARRLIHGIVAKYYTRTARLFLFDFPPEVDPSSEETLDLLTRARAQLADTLLANREAQPAADTSERDELVSAGFPHARLSPEHAETFARRLNDLLYEFATAPSDPDGQIYGFCMAFFPAPPYLQARRDSSTRISPLEDD